jgi:endonuclease/exonuclease/phosphatase family metal-dependent hydrolase
MSLRIATYNIHRCIGRDNVEDPFRIAAVLREMDADVVALQEVANHPHASGSVLDILANAIGGVAVAGVTLQDKRGMYGNALVSRLPVTTVHRLDLSVSKREPRGAIDVSLNVGNKLLKVVTTHLGLRSWERRYQVKRMLPLFTDTASAEVTVLLGDLNLWYRWSRPLQWLNHVFGAIPAPPTFPSHRPVLALDRFWIRPRNRLILLRPHRSPLARMASDHLPLVAAINL